MGEIRPSSENPVQPDVGGACCGCCSFRREESIWDASWFVFYPDMGSGASLHTLLLLLLNIVAQVVFFRRLPDGGIADGSFVN